MGLTKTTTSGGEEDPTGGMLRARGYIVFPMNNNGRGHRRMLVAVGPEGGWEELY
jgi:16S rRNA U1498 N3-methylase RsmE